MNKLKYLMKSMLTKTSLIKHQINQSIESFNYYSIFIIITLPLFLTRDEDFERAYLNEVRGAVYFHPGHCRIINNYC